MREKYRDEAERASLSILLKISREFLKVYCSSGTIEERLPKGPYGNVVSTDVPNLLKKYIARGLVEDINIMGRNNKINKRYRANLEKISEIEKIINS